MTNTEVLQWIKDNLSPYIRKAITPGLIYTEDWLAAITLRETGGLIARYAPTTSSVIVVASMMMGDYTQRKGETSKRYHGYGFTQIDIDSFPEFILSGKWKDPYECYLKTIDVLEGKRKYLKGRFIFANEELLHYYITAAYNCGEGNEGKVVAMHEDPDKYTTGHDYSKAVSQFRQEYKSLV